MLLSKIRVVGHSMEPTFKHNQTIIASSIPFIFTKAKVGDIVILRHGRCIIKRIVKINKNKVFVAGDNRNQSTDSRDFGWVSRDKIAGKVIYKL